MLGKKLSLLATLHASKLVLWIEFIYRGFDFTGNCGCDHGSGVKYSWISDRIRIRDADQKKKIA
jgi:hypothetical protein